MISTKNRVQAIKSKFENLNNENDRLIIRKSVKQLCQQESIENTDCGEEVLLNNSSPDDKNDSESNDESPKPNSSYLYSRIDPKRSVSDVRKSLTRQTSDPGKKLHRSHAFRCDKSQKIGQSPKRHGSCNGRSETSDFTLKMGDKKLSKERLKRLGNLLENQMRKENFVPPSEEIVSVVYEVASIDSIPDENVPKHILDQYAKVNKPKKKEEKQDAMTDSGVSSETENLDDDKNGKIKRLTAQFEKTEDDPNCNLEVMNNLCASSETMKLERKNPHLILTDTLKKALKQPLPAGPPPKKPPRTFIASIPENAEKQKKDPKKMLEKLEQVLQKRESQNQKNIYDIAEADLSNKKPKEVHYLCTEILDITQRTLLPNQNPPESLANCFNSLNCTVLSNSTASLPYTRLSNRSSTIEPIKGFCSCNLDENKRFSTFLTGGPNKCTKCLINEEKHDQFKCHMHCKCKEGNSEFFVDKEPIYDEPFNEKSSTDFKDGTRNNQYGTLNKLKEKENYSKSLEDLRTVQNDDSKIYDIPCDVSRSETPDFTTSSPKSEFQKLRENFEKGFQNENRSSKSDNEIDGKRVAEIPELKKRSIDLIDKISEINDRKFGTEISENRNSTIEVVEKRNMDKPPLTPKPNFYVKKMAKSSENLAEDVKSTKRLVEKKFGTDAKRYRSRVDSGTGVLSLPKKNCTQLDVDRENVLRDTALCSTAEKSEEMIRSASELNRLMNEIYDTVTAACNMEERKPGSFPTDSLEGSTSEDSVKLTRSLTEKRKNYVRRVSSRVAYLDQSNVKKATRFRHQTSVCSYKSEIIDNPYSTFRSWKSFRTSRTNLSKDSKMADSTDSKFNLTDSTGNILSMRDDFDSESIEKLSIDEKTGCVDIELPFEPRERGLFNVCLLVGLNYMTGQAYVKSIFPNQVQVPPHIENLIFPETLSPESKGEWSAEAKGAQCYSLVLTDERGERAYGYCRRVLPEGASTCLPLCYCLIGRYRAPGFYYKVLQEIESHHGSSEVEINSILQQLFETDLPNPGEEITLTYKTTTGSVLTETSFRNSINLGDLLKCKTMPDMRRSNQNDSPETGSNRLGTGVNQLGTGVNQIGTGLNRSTEDLESKNGLDDGNQYSNREDMELPKFLDLENNNGPKRVLLSLENKKSKIIKRPLEPRVDEDNLSILLDSFGAGLVIKVFSSLLLERKVVIVSDKLSVVSSCMEALQSSLYPFVWQQPLISTIPSEIQRDVLEAPLPILAGMLNTGDADFSSGVVFEEGMLIDLTHPSKVLYYQGDESTILPTSSYKTLKTSLQMESSKHKDRSEDKKTRNVMISEAFLRFFVDILGDFWKYFSVGEVKEDDLGKGNVIFDKDAYIKNAPSKQTQYFLEWFTETAMFTHFIQNMCAARGDGSQALVDAPLPRFYSLLDERIEGRNVSDGQKNNYKSAMNKKVKLLKNKLRDLIA